MRLLLTSALLILLYQTADALALKTYYLFADNMVLQRDMPVPVWGTGKPGCKTIVQIAGQSVETTVGNDGRWLIKLTPLVAGGPHKMKIVSDNETILVKNIMIGDVWICAGQSNMQMRVQDAFTGGKVPEISKNNNLRLFKDKWLESSIDNVKVFSAIGYFWGQQICDRVKVPIGLIYSAVGGSRIESWIDPMLLKNNPEFSGVLEASEQGKISFEEYRKRKKLNPGLKARPEFPPQWIAGNVFTRFKRILPFAIKGIIWYQGESNVDVSHHYGKLLKIMVKDWRKLWKYDFAFLSVQLPRFGKPQTHPEESKWAELRDAQTQILSLPNTALAVTIDSGGMNLHPFNKKLVAGRLAVAAEGLVYKQRKIWMGPLYKHMEIKGNKIKVSFTSGENLKTGNQLPVAGFTIAGNDRQFYVARADIQGDSVMVYSAEVEKPVAVRYAWADNPDGCNLINENGLPASPFKTDSWLGLTNNNL